MRGHRDATLEMPRYFLKYGWLFWIASFTLHKSYEKIRYWAKWKKMPDLIATRALVDGLGAGSSVGIMMTNFCCRMYKECHCWVCVGVCVCWGEGTIFPAYINICRPRRNGHHFAGNIFKHIFFNENVWISIEISLKLVPKGPNSNIPALVRIMRIYSAPSHYLNPWC